MVSGLLGPGRWFEVCVPGSACSDQAGQDATGVSSALTPPLNLFVLRVPCHCVAPPPAQLLGTDSWEASLTPPHVRLFTKFWAFYLQDTSQTSSLSPPSSARSPFASTWMAGSFLSPLWLLAFQSLPAGPRALVYRDPEFKFSSGC